VRRWDFGDIPSRLVVNHAGLALTMYPGIADAGGSVALRLYPDAVTATAQTRRGLIRLAALAVPQQHELVRRSCAADRELGLLAAVNGLGRSLFDEVADRAVADATLDETAGLPSTKDEFETRIDRGRGAVADAGEEVARIVRATLAALKDARSQLALAPPAAAAAQAASERQIARLTAPGWVRDTPRPWFMQLPKYARALARRAERLRGELDRDRRLAAQVEPYERALRELEAAAPDAAARPRLVEFAWSIEEFRLSLHAQELRTRAPVSAKRLDEQLALARAEALSVPGKV
jgi:ATP-dependent helicase HrpA